MIAAMGEDSGASILRLKVRLLHILGDEAIGRETETVP